MTHRFSCLYDFVGYGRKPPRFVCLGIEEYGSGSELSFEARCASSAKPLFDKNEACHSLAHAFRDHGQPEAARKLERALEEPGYVAVWRFCAMVVAAVRTPGDWLTTWKTEYGALGTRSGHTIVASLFPVPKPGIAHWPEAYKEWFGFETARQYYSAMWPLRKELLQSVIVNELPADCVILCYGKSFWNHFSDLFGVDPQSWTAIIPDRAEAAVTPKGLRVVRTGFPFGRPSRSRVTAEHVPAIAEALSVRGR